MKSKLFEKLKTEGSSFGLSDEAIGGVVELLSANLTSESSEEDLTKVSSLGLGMMKTIQSTTQREVSRIAKPKTEPKKVEPPKIVEEVKNDEMPEWAKAMLESNKQLAERVQELQGTNVKRTREQQLREVYKGVSKEVADKLIGQLEYIQFSDDSFGDYIETQKLIADGIRAKEGAEKVNSIGQTKFSVASDKLPSEEKAREAFPSIKALKG